MLKLNAFLNEKNDDFSSREINRTILNEYWINKNLLKKYIIASYNNI